MDALVLRNHHNCYMIIGSKLLQNIRDPEKVIYGVLIATKRP